MPAQPISDADLLEALRILKASGGIREAAKAAKMSFGGFRSRLATAKKRGLTLTNAKSNTKSNGKANGKLKSGRSLQDFRAEYDKDFIVPQKISDALRILGDGWEYEVQFAKLASVGLVDLASYRDAFAEHVVVLGREGRRAWAGTKEAAAKMREMLGR